MFTTGGIGWYLVIGALAYAFTRARSSFAAQTLAVDPTTGLPIVADHGPLEVPPELRAPLEAPSRNICLQSLCPDGSARASDCSCPGFDYSSSLLPVRMLPSSGGYI